MAGHPSFVRAKEEYDQQSEYLFRRELENLLVEIISEIVAISSGRGKESSLYSKRESYKLPVGTVTLT